MDDITRLKVLKAYDKLPKQIKKVLRLEENFYKLEIVKNIKNNEYILGESEVLYREWELERYIRIKSRDEDELIRGKFYISIETVFYHECGHAIHYELMLNDIKILNEFIDIFKKEKESFVTNGCGYYKYSINEYFAQSFSEYFINPNRLRENTPETYEFIKTFIEDCEDLF